MYSSKNVARVVFIALLAHFLCCVESSREEMILASWAVIMKSMHFCDSFLKGIFHSLQHPNSAAVPIPPIPQRPNLPPDIPSTDEEWDRFFRRLDHDEDGGNVIAEQSCAVLNYAQIP